MGGKLQGRTTHLALVVAGVTRSDLLPYIGLALGLMESGFNVKLITHQVHSDTIARYGVAHAALKGDPQAVLRTSAFRDAVLSGNVLSMGLLFMNEDKKSREANFELIYKACRDVDGILCSISVLTECLAVAQKYQIALMLCPLLPFSPSGEIPLATVVPEPLKYSFINRFSYDVSGILLWSYYGGTYNKFRAKIGVGPQANYVLEGIPQVTSFSPVVIPRPSDWGSQVHCTSHWKVPDLPGQRADDRSAHPALAALLADPPSSEPSLRPVLISFESVPLPDPVAYLRAAYALAAKIGVPVIMAADTEFESVRSSPRLADLSGLVFDAPGGDAAAAAFMALQGPRLLVVGDVSPSSILPRCSVAVHHGTSFMTQAALEAGVPAVVFPVSGSDFFWAARVSALGAGPLVHYPLRQFEERLLEGVTVARQAHVLNRAAATGVALRGLGDGVQQAVAIMRDVLARPQHRHCGVSCAWAADGSSDSCTVCSVPFTFTNRRRHCRSCGCLACGKCLSQRCHLPGFPEDAPQIVCERCLDSRRAFFAMHAGVSVLPPLPGGAAGTPGMGAVSGAGATVDVSLTPSAHRGPDASAMGSSSGIPPGGSTVKNLLLSPLSAGGKNAAASLASPTSSFAATQLRSADGTFSPLPV